MQVFMYLVLRLFTLALGEWMALVHVVFPH